jgi:hypothetical protein
LEVTPELVGKIVKNFHAGVRDDIPIPLGHEPDAISSIGQVVGLEVDEEGLWGIHEIANEDDAEKIGSTWTGSSALIDMNAVDKETDEELGPVLVHNAITNAPYIKDLAPFEAIALGEAAKDAVVIPLHGIEQGGVSMTLEETLKAISETSDDDLRKALTEARPELFAVANSEDDDAKDKTKAALEAAKGEGKKELIASLAEKGITVALSESAKDSDDEPEVDITSAPEFVKLGGRVTSLEGDIVKAKAETTIDKAIKDGKVIPATRDGLLEVALGEGGMDRLAKLIPEKAVVDLSEHGVNLSDETNVELSEKDAAAEADRLIATYATTTKKE